MGASREQGMAEAAAAALLEPVCFAKGTTVILTAGAYDDLCISECLLTCVDCDLSALAQCYVGEINPERHAYQDRTDDFANWLVARRYAVRSSAEKVHLGDYSTFGTNLVPACANASTAAAPA